MNVAGIGNKIPSMDVINIAIMVIIFSIARDLGRVVPNIVL